MKNQSPPKNKFDTDVVSSFRESRAGSISEKGRFERDSLTSTETTYRRVPSSREVPDQMQDRADFALQCMILEGKDSSARVVICKSTPQWVSDLVNTCTDPSGVCDEWRQRFIHEALKMIRSGSPPSVARSDSFSTLKSWARSTSGKKRYIDAAEKIMSEDRDRKEVLSLAQRLECIDVYYQVYSALDGPFYDGRLYDIGQLRRMHRRETSPGEGD